MLNLATALKSTRRGITIVSATILINAFSKAVQADSFAVLDWWILSLLAVGTPFFVSLPFEKLVLPRHFRSQERYIAEHTGGIARSALASNLDLKKFETDYYGYGLLWLMNTAWFAFQPWLYFRGLRRGYQEGCAVEIFTVWKYVSIYNSHWVIFEKVVAVACIVITPFSLGLAVGLIVFGLRSRGREDFRASSGPKPEGGSPPAHTIEPIESEASAKARLKRLKHQYNFKKWGLLLLAALAYLTAMAAIIPWVELTIERNGIDLSGAPLQSTSQLLPFLVAVFNLWMVGWGAAWKALARVVAEVDKIDIRMAMETLVRELLNAYVRSRARLGLPSLKNMGIVGKILP
jgi:hypothetical protein